MFTANGLQPEMSGADINYVCKFGAWLNKIGKKDSGKFVTCGRKRR